MTTWKEHPLEKEPVEYIHLGETHELAEERDQAAATDTGFTVYPNGAVEYECELAGEDAHDVRDGPTIFINHVGTDRAEDNIGNLGTYLAAYLGTYGDDPLDAPDYVQMGNTLLWATGKQRWRPSNGAQSYMASEYKSQDAESPWEIIGILDGEEIRPAPEEGGGVDRFVTGPLGLKGPPSTEVSK